MVMTMLAILMLSAQICDSGDIIYTRNLGSDIIIINSEAVAKELLENRSKNYSDRPYMATKSL